MRKHNDLLCSTSSFRRWTGCSSCSITFTSSTCRVNEFIFLSGHACTEQKVSKAVLKTKKVGKKKILCSEVWKVFA